MKKLLVTLILTFLFAGNIFSQDSSKSNEIGVYFTSTYRYGIRYKHGNENLMFRITALRFSSDSYDSEYNTGEQYESDEIGFGLNLGMEIPISITEKFNFFYGPELSGEYSYDEEKYVDNYTYRKVYEFGLGFIMGFAYKINTELLISVELVPSLYYRYREH